MTERRPYLLVWSKNSVLLRPEVFAEDEEVKPTAVYGIGKGSWLKLSLPAALAGKHPAEWIFWPSGNCEPAIVQFKGPAGTWTADYSPLTGQPELTQYASKIEQRDQRSADREVKMGFALYQGPARCGHLCHRRDRAWTRGGELYQCEHDQRGGQALCDRFCPIEWRKFKRRPAVPDPEKEFKINSNYGRVTLTPEKRACGSDRTGQYAP